MEALLIETDRAESWLRELADEFVEDPHCRILFFGGDPHGAILMSVWNEEMAAEVAAGLRTVIPPDVEVRVLALADTGAEERLGGKGLRE